jgi:hypothetical protein
MKSLNALVAAALCAAATYSVNAFAQSDVAATVRSEPNPKLKRNSLEIRPIESLASVTPGLAAGGLSFETYLGRQWALTVGGSYADIDLPGKYVTTAEDKNDHPMVERGYGYSTGAGLRYYNDPIGDSVYGGLSVDYSEARVGWDYKDEKYKSTQIAVTPSLAVGYRWVWQNGLLARLGAGAGLPSVQTQKVVTETAGPDATAGADKIDDTLDTKVVPKLDLGLGMMF